MKVTYNKISDKLICGYDSFELERMFDGDYLAEWINNLIKEAVEEKEQEIRSEYEDE